MTFPEIPSKSFLNKLGAAWKSFTGQEVEKDIPIPSYEEMQAECLHLFLGKQQEVLQDITIAKFNFVNCVNSVLRVFRQLRFQRLCDGDNPSDGRRVAGNLAKVFDFN